LKLVEENNKQKFELMKPNDDLKNDIQTIKQLLLTRQTSFALVSEKEKEEVEEEQVLSGSSSLASSTSTSALKPWEQRRRARIEGTPGAGSSGTATPPTTPVTPSLANVMANIATPVAPAVSISNPVLTTTPAMEEE
jgi:hypothetical protein